MKIDDLTQQQIQDLISVLSDYFVREFGPTDSIDDEEELRELCKNDTIPLAFTELDDKNNNTVEIQINYNLKTQHIDYWLTYETSSGDLEEVMASENDQRQDITIDQLIEFLPGWSFDDIVRDAYDYIDELNEKE